MWLTDAATAARNRADQAALSNAAEVSRAQWAATADALAKLREHTSFTALLARHGLVLFFPPQPNRRGRSGTTEGVTVLGLAVLRGYVGRLLRDAEAVNWLARHEPAHLRTFQCIMEVERLPQADNYRRRKPETLP